MAMHTGLGLSKILVLVGAGFTGSIVLRNGRLADILAELQIMTKGLDKSREQSGSDHEYTDAVALQVRQLAMEVRQLASARPVTVHNGNAGQGGNMTSLIVPAATLGALGYGYMWWRGLSFSDLMYVTKRSMDKAVSSLKENLEIVSASLDALKSYFTQRIKNLDEKLDEQKEMSTEIIKEVIDAQNKVTNIGYDLNSLQQLVCGLDLKMSIIEDKQNKEYNGVRYLCNYVAENSRKSADLRQIEQMITGAREIKDEQKATGTRETKGLQHIVEAIESKKFDKPKTEAILQDDPNSNSLKCQSVLGLPFYYSKLLDPTT